MWRAGIPGPWPIASAESREDPPVRCDQELRRAARERRRRDDGASIEIDRVERRAVVVGNQGQRAIARYGCFSCHQIKGFETTQPIGTDLSEEGTKLVTRLDFAGGHEWTPKISAAVAGWLAGQR